MDILKNFFSKFIILIIIVVCIILFTKSKHKVIDGTVLVDSAIDKRSVKIEKGAYIVEPKQKKITQETSNVTIGGIKVNMTKLAKYDITGVVIDTEKYNEVIGPIDIALAWGELAENYNYKNFTSYDINNRTFIWKANNSGWIKKMGGEDGISKNCSNNHLVPANDNVRKQLLRISKDEYIRLTGYLVKLEWQVGNTKHVWGPSSLSRNDKGESACEIIYVQAVNFL